MRHVSYFTYPIYTGKTVTYVTVRKTPEGAYTEVSRRTDALED